MIFGWKTYLGYNTISFWSYSKVIGRVEHLKAAVEAVIKLLKVQENPPKPVSYSLDKESRKKVPPLVVYDRYF